MYTHWEDWLKDEDLHGSRDCGTIRRIEVSAPPKQCKSSDI